MNETDERKQNTAPSPVVEPGGSLRGSASSPPKEGGEKRRGGLNKSELVSIAFQLGFIIAIPVIAFGYLGKWLDGKAGTYPLLTLIGIFTAIVFTSTWIYRKFKSYFKT